MSDRHIRVFPVMPHMIDATSFYRAQLPMTELSHHKNCQLVYSTEVTWGTMALADVLFLQRPFDEKSHVVMAQICEKMNRKLWCDWDDDLFCLPPDNPAHGMYATKEVQMSVATLAAMADVVTVSTPALARRMDDIRRRSGKPSSIVIPNALSDHFIQRRHQRILDPKRRKLIFWRGSSSHQADLDSVQHQLVDLMKSELGQTWTLHFMGYNPYRITNALPAERCIVGGGMDVLDYHEYFMTVQPGITIVPLCDHDFNRAKSNIAWLEATLAHSLVVAPDLEEWRRPGVFTYKGPEDFPQTMRLAMACVEESQYVRVDQSWDHITSNLLLSRTNEQRWELLKSLCPHKPQS